MEIWHILGHLFELEINFLEASHSKERKKTVFLAEASQVQPLVYYIKHGCSI